MTVIRIKSARLAAPSFKSRAIAGMGKMVRGQVPLSRVVVARDEAGYQWVHNTVFASRDGVKADRIAEAVRERGFIDATYWRKADPREY
jgi:hypothetical protein